MDAADIAWLRTEGGVAATAQAATWVRDGVGELAILDRLRRAIDPTQARAVLALLEGRRSASAKFEDAGALFFDREAAEQATSEAVARHTGERFTGAARVADLGCGAGGDALAIAAYAPVLAVDRDPARLAMLEANAVARGIASRIARREGNAASFVPLDVDALWFDPARRDDRGRVRDPEAWSPPLSDALRIASTVPRAGIKVAPGIELSAAPPEAELEFISHNGTLVEAVIWLGLAVTAPRRATVLVDGSEGASVGGYPDTGATPLREPGRYLYDLDPGVGRASLVDAVAPLLRAGRLDERTAYLTGDEAASSPFARRFRVESWLPFSERQLREALLRLGTARVEVMRRASPVETNVLEVRLNRALADSRGPVRTVAVTRVRGEHVAIICARESGAPGTRSGEG